MEFFCNFEVYCDKDFLKVIVIKIVFKFIGEIILVFYWNFLFVEVYGFDFGCVFFDEFCDV